MTIAIIIIPTGDHKDDSDSYDGLYPYSITKLNSKSEQQGVGDYGQVTWIAMKIIESK